MQKVKVSDKRESILQAAERLFCEHGFEGTTTRMISAESGANIAMITYYFGGKEGVLEALLSNLIIHFPAKKINAADDSGTVYAELLGVMGTLVGDIVGNYRLFKIMQAELITKSRQESYQKLRSLRQNNQKFVEGVVYKGIQAGEFRDVDVPLFVLNMISLTKNVVIWPRTIVWDVDISELNDDNKHVVINRLTGYMKDLIDNYLLIKK